MKGFSFNMPEPPPGLFITKGMNVSINRFSITINHNGEFENNEMIVQTGLDMCPYWLNIAYKQLLITKKINKQLLDKKEILQEESIGRLLEKEFMHGMQAIMAACIAIDAYYASVKNYANIPKEVSKNWKKNGTARYKQIAETLKTTFSIPQATFLKIREVLRQCFELRDRAVHPKTGTDKPVLHPEANIISDWRYSAFRYENAKAVVGHALSIIYQTAIQDKKGRCVELKKTCEKQKKEIEPILTKWVEKYGNLF
jgi:hypothetical protein